MPPSPFQARALASVSRTSSSDRPVCWRMSRQGEDVEVAHAVVLRAGPTAGSSPGCIADRLAVPDRAERRAAAEVAGDDLEILAAQSSAIRPAM